MKHWYALYTKPHAEHRVATLLRQKEIEVYLPELDVTLTKKIKKKKPFFPNYLFARIDLEFFPLSALQWVSGLRYTVTFNRKPALVPQSIITLIRQKMGELNEKGGMPIHSFKHGDSVRVTDGPFEGMIGIFDENTTSAERVRILLTVLGNINRTQISVDALEKAPSADTSIAPQKKRPRRTRGRGRRIIN